MRKIEIKEENFALFSFALPIRFYNIIYIQIQCHVLATTTTPLSPAISAGRLNLREIAKNLARHRENLAGRDR